MSKFKKFAAGLLATALLVTSIAVPAPKEAEAATYCCHNIYLIESKYYTTHTVGECGPFLYWTYIGPKEAICKLQYDVYLNTYGCYKCNYTTKTYHSGNVYHSSHGLCK